jgi:heme exporter protein D
MEFLEMDKYAAHVWTVYGFTFLLIIGNAWFSRAQFLATRSKVLRRLKSRPQPDEQTNEQHRDSA